MMVPREQYAAWQMRCDAFHEIISEENAEWVPALVSLVALLPSRISERLLSLNFWVWAKREQWRRLVELGLKGRGNQRPMRSAIWIWILAGSTIGGFIPLLWGGDMISYSGVLFSGLGAFFGLWLGLRE